jgi:Tfp pilus assembly protein PilN
VKVLNLASRPFRNERLPTLLVLAGTVLALALTVEHVLVIRRLRPARSLGEQVTALDRESQSLRAEGERLRVVRPDPAASAHWLVLKDLVDRKVFSWTGLFAVLEDALPQSVRLVSIAPGVKKGEVTLGLEAVARSREDGLDFIRILEEREEFYDVVPTSRGGEDGTEFRYFVKYRPAPAPVAAPSPAPAAGEGDSKDAAGDTSRGAP